MNKYYPLQLLVLFILIYQPSRLSACGAPPPKIVGSINVCQNKHAIYKISDTTYKSYKWTAKNALIASGQGSTKIILLWDTAANIELELVTEDYTGCKDTAHLTININKPFKADAGPDYSVCPNTKVKIGPSQPLTGKTYVWYDARYTNKEPLYTEANPVIKATPSLYRDISIPLRVVITDTLTGCAVNDTVIFFVVVALLGLKKSPPK
ncbi:MAG: hypothetical protein EOP51_32605 [Sphingobacteriales bacterium]|nr:MAG: hypothetical protein EOP51_32605 [Sphingobacteriales bacterium]